MFRATSQTQDAVAFRGWFFKLSELRFLVSDNIPFMAVTATATRRTEETIISVLRLGKFIEVFESPNRPISYLLVRPSSCQGLPQRLLFTKLDSLKDNLQWKKKDIYKLINACTEATQTINVKLFCLVFGILD